MKDEIKVKILRCPKETDWLRCKLLALNTVGKKYPQLQREKLIVSSKWKNDILDAGHSPIRTLMFTIEMQIPYYVSVHFSRHKFGVEHYVTSQRNDRQSNYDRELAPQNMMVTHIMDINAQELIFMSHKRLCKKADATTSYVMSLICQEIIETNPEFKNHLEPECEYRKGCHEFNSCGYYNENNHK